jgi:hypothetical protein
LGGHADVVVRSFNLFRNVGLPADEIFDPEGSFGTTARAITNPTLTRAKGAFGSQLVSGWYTTASGATQGFEILPNGTIKSPIVDPNDTLNNTATVGINNAGTVVGDYENTVGGADTFHGFQLAPDGTFTTFDEGEAGVSTGIQAINDNGDIAGDFGSSVQPSQGFLLPKGGKLVTFGVPGLATFPQAMNNSDTVVGVYQDASGNYHSFMRTVDGTLTTFDFPRAVSTHAEGINNFGTIDGYFTDTAGKTHGFF